MKVHSLVESPGLSLNTMGMAVVSALVSSEAARLEFGEQILSPRFVNTYGNWTLVGVAEFTGNSCCLQG